MMHWSVTVSRNGEEIVTIESNFLAGREISPADEDAIRSAAHSLLTFIGDPQPAPRPPYPFCRTPDRCAGKGYCPRDPACNE